MNQISKILVSLCTLLPAQAEAHDVQWRVTVAEVTFNLRINVNRFTFELPRSARLLSPEELDRHLSAAVVEISGPTCRLHPQSIIKTRTSVTGELVC